MITEKLKLICKKILDLSKNKISNLALQKLLYLIQAYSLIDSNEPVFEDKIEAWQYGPAVPEAYYYVRYKKKELDSLSTNNLKKNTEKKNLQKTSNDVLQKLQKTSSDVRA